MRIPAEQQKVIATWASLKAMVAEFDGDGCVTTHHMRRKLMFRKQIPPSRGWAVWIGHFKRHRWVGDWGSNPFLFLSDEDKRCRAGEKATFFNSHVSTQVIGQLFIQVMRCPMRDFVEGWRFAPPNKGSLFRIWPPSGTTVAWPGRTMSDHDADYAASAVYNFLVERGRAAALREATAAKP